MSEAIDLLLKDILLSFDIVEVTEEGIETIEPFLSLSEDKSLFDFILFILNTFRSLFENETLGVSDTIEDEVEGRR